MRNIIVISILISSLLSVSYAMANPINPFTKTGIIAKPNFRGISTNSADPYEYCFGTSTWIVPPQTLLAYLYDNATTTAVQDQTVWVFSNYNQGYFTGQSYTALNNAILSQKYLIGTVTSEGKVLITFYSGTSTSTDLVSGTGTLEVKSSGQCSFIMQMNSGTNGVSGLVHWSYMIPVKPGDALYENLPSTGMSVPQFLARF